jgi:hypothetical protein
MIPEIDSRPRIYKSSSFPFQWEVNRTDIFRNRMVDPAIFFFADTWWLLGSFKDRYTNQLYMHLYSSSDPISGQWLKTNGNTDSRNKDRTEGSDFHYHTRVGIRAGGRVFVYNNELYRIVQQSAHSSYGSSIDLYRVVRDLKVQSLQQRVVPEFKTNLRKPDVIGDWNRNRFHHCDIQPFLYNNDKQLFVVAIDGNEDSADKDTLKII